mmetsp:Transcript_11952/g.34420  ORF Transcript_11952/g.34420 Transcript_11952/m.34420 type:complete len:219 (-) Transcript_11952:666-1322(-)
MLFPTVWRGFLDLDVNGSQPCHGAMPHRRREILPKRHIALECLPIHLDEDSREADLDCLHGELLVLGRLLLRRRCNALGALALPLQRLSSTACLLDFWRCQGATWSHVHGSVEHVWPQGAWHAKNEGVADLNGRHDRKASLWFHQMCPPMQKPQPLGEGPPLLAAALSSAQRRQGKHTNGQCFASSDGRGRQFGRHTPNVLDVQSTASLLRLAAAKQR